RRQSTLSPCIRPVGTCTMRRNRDSLNWEAHFQGQGDHVCWQMSLPGLTRAIRRRLKNMKRLCFWFPLVLLVEPAFAQGSFFQFPIDQDALGGAPDFSFLNHLLQPADQLAVIGGHFCRIGATLAREDASITEPSSRTALAFDVCDRVPL